MTPEPSVCQMADEVLKRKQVRIYLDREKEERFAQARWGNRLNARIHHYEPFGFSGY